MSLCKFGWGKANKRAASFFLVCVANKPRFISVICTTFLNPKIIEQHLWSNFDSNFNGLGRRKATFELLKVIISALHGIGGSIVRHPNRFTNEVSLCFDEILWKKNPMMKKLIEILIKSSFTFTSKVKRW